MSGHLDAWRQAKRLIEEAPLSLAQAGSLAKQAENDPDALYRRHLRAVATLAGYIRSGHAFAPVGPGGRAERRQWHDFEMSGRNQRRWRHGKWEYRTLRTRKTNRLERLMRNLQGVSP